MASIRDVCSEMIVGGSVCSKIIAELIEDILTMAIARKDLLKVAYTVAPTGHPMSAYF